MEESIIKSKKILVIVPHEDDEINLAGSVMYGFLHQGYEVHCAFTTNGDYSFNAETRMNEAIHALHILGVQNIYFLGYGDTPNFYKNGHIFYAKNSVISPAGHGETYGLFDFPDYAWLKRHSHSLYDRQHFKEDLRTLILDIHANVIFCNDYDVHSDHRASSILFEEVMGEILRCPGNTYHPAVFKGFAYCTSFSSPQDFYEINLLSVPCPDEKNEIIGCSLYEWDARVRFPILPQCRSFFMRHNIIYKALFEHKSQSAALHAVSIINGDSVFWQRRTDSLSYQADIITSSGIGERTADFKLLDSVDIDTKEPKFDYYLWTPDELDSEKKISFHWDTGQTISLVRVFGNIDLESRVMSWTISFDTGYRATFGPLPQYGKAFSAVIPTQHDVHLCTIQILEWHGNRYGFAECEFYSTDQQKTVIKPFIKLKIEDNFVYDYILHKVDRQVQLEIYAYPINMPVTFTLLAGSHSCIDETGNLHIGSEDYYIKVRAEVKSDHNIFDEITLRRKSNYLLWKLIVMQKIEKILLTWYLKKYRKYIHIQHKYLKRL